MDTHPNPISTDFDTELLYAFAWLRFREFESYRWSLLNSGAPITEGEEMSRALRALVDSFGDNRLRSQDLPELIEHLRRGEEYRNTERLSRYENGMLCSWALSEDVAITGYRGAVAMPLEQLLNELEALLHRFQQAKRQGITIEKGLLEFLGDDAAAERIALEVIARTQYITDPEVAGIWWIVILCIDKGWLPAENIEIFIHEQTPWCLFGSNAAGLEICDDGTVSIRLGPGRYSCPLAEITSEFRTLIKRFYNSIG